MRGWILGVALVGCAAEEEVPPPTIADSLGISRLLGTAEVSDTEVDGDVTTWTFDEASGPLCLRGDPFRMATRDTGSDDLVLFLQGGGACWSAFCFAVTKAPAGVPGVDILRTDLPDNPVADWNVGFLPYCDGSLFAGERDHDDDGDGTTDRYHRGLANLSASLDVVREAFPAPKRVLLSGSSGGGFATLLAPMLVRHVYPEAELIVLNDSGVGVVRGAADVAFVETLIDEFNAASFVPDDCEGCLETGHIAPLIGWALDRDPGLRVGVFTSWYDAIIGDVFLDIDPEAFRDSVASVTGALHAAHPDRYRRFIVDSRMHTTLLGDPSGIIGSDLSAVEIPPEAFSRLADLDIGALTETAVGDLRFVDWVDALIRGDDAGWPDTVEPATPR